MNRLVQDGRDLKEQLALIYKYQSAFTVWFHYLKDNGKLPVYDAGYISLDKQYLTVGINGIVEAAEYLGLKANYNPEYVYWLQNILGTMKQENKNASKYYSDKLGYKVRFNSEFVPAEAAGAKLYKWDKRDGYQVPDESVRNLYNSYFYPVEDKSVTVYDKIKLHGEETIKYLDGGSALHLNFEEHLTKEGWLKLLDITARFGANYWTYNVRSTICNVCGYIGKKDLDHCIKCGSTDVDKATRVIGYLRRESNFSEPRRIEASRRYKHKK
jgi:ribonucleoside-triphosphate reductase